MKARYLLLIMLAMLGLTGCEEKDVSNKFHSDTLDLLIERGDWEFDNETMQFFCHFDIPDITADIYDNGNWSICREFEKGTKDAFQVALPMSMFMTDTLSDNSVVYYTQHIDYRLSVGYVEIQLTNSDYLYPTDEKGKLIPPYEMSFRLQLIY
ncbi:MAG: hypothetical protein IKT13_06365 [Paludibacteraceae bacterium]|nr:hypothetical protein [Paludibacteraceae bacterium]